MAASASADLAPAQRIDVGRAALDVIDVGVGPPLLFLHGFPERAAGWLPIMRDLVRDHRCIAPDQRGYGDSTRFADDADYAIEQLVADVAALLDTLGLARATLVGHDWGGIVASAFAALHPGRTDRLVLVNGPHPAALQEALLDDPNQRAASAYIERLRAPGAATRLTDGGQAPWHRFDAAALDAMLAWYRAAPLVVPGGPGEPRPAWLDEHDWRVRCPTLAIWGLRDAALPASLLGPMARWIPRLTVAQVADAGHDVIHTAPSLVADNIRRFVAP